MFQSRIARIALAVFLVIALAVVAYFLFFAKKSEESASDIAKTTVPDDQYAGSGTLPAYSPVSTRSATGSTGSPDILPSQSALAPTALPTAQTTTPYPGSGVFDWTQNKTPTPIEVELTADQIQKLQSGDICEISNISDSWSDPVEKISCSFAKYMEKQVIIPLQIMACNFIGTAISTNYKPGVEAKLEGNFCKIIDR